MSTEKKKEQQLLEDVTAQPAVQPSYSTAGLNSSKEVENALANAEYVPGQSVTNAAADLKNWQQNRPGKYESAYQGRIEDLIGQLLERNSFQYSYAQDPLYRQYAQQYTQNARNASADAAAQAAALTGGYGSSYAASVAQQAYQQQIGRPERRPALPSTGWRWTPTRASGDDARDPKLDQLNVAGTERPERSITRSWSDYYSQLRPEGRAPTTLPMRRTMGSYQDYLGRLDTLYGYYSDAGAAGRQPKRQQKFNRMHEQFWALSGRRGAAGHHRHHWHRLAGGYIWPTAGYNCVCQRPRLCGRAVLMLRGSQQMQETAAAGQP